MKNILFFTVLSATPAMAAAPDINELAKRVDALEFQSFENSLSWSGFFEARYDALTIKPDGAKKYTLNISRSVAGIDFKAKPLKNVTLFGRLTYSSVFNNYGTVDPSDNHGRSYTNSGALFERLFLNYGITDGLTFSVGRLPTLDGPPSHNYDGLSRQGSYPRAVYSSILDGYALSYNVPLPSDRQQLTARVAYTPLSHINVQSVATGRGYFRDEITATNPATGATVGTGAYKNSTTPLTSWMLDYSLDGSAVAQNVTAIYQGFNFKGFKSTPTWKFDYTLHLFYLELKDIASTGLTAYGSYVKTQLANHGGVTVAPGMTFGFGAAEADKTLDGKSTTTGLIYTIPVDALKQPLIGYEMYAADKNSFQFDAAARDPMGFYTQRGKGGHVFYTQPLNSNVKLRIGLMDSKPEYAEGINVGPITETKDTMKSIYANLRTDF